MENTKKMFSQLAWILDITLNYRQKVKVTRKCERLVQELCKHVTPLGLDLRTYKRRTKKLSFCHKLRSFNPSVFATFNITTMHSFRSNSYSLKNQRSMDQWQRLNSIYEKLFWFILFCRVCCSIVSATNYIITKKVYFAISICFNFRNYCQI